MIIEIDQYSGFCNGVIRAINLAEKELTAGETLFCLGDIVHNELEVERLKSIGLQTIEHPTFQNLTNKKVLIRAHGEPPATYQTAVNNHLTIIDATCPVVLGLQKKVHTAYTQSLLDNGQVVIYGKNGHAEVNGLTGQTQQTAIVVNSIEDLSNLDFTRPIRLFSQTTMSMKGFEKLCEAILTHRDNLHVNKNILFEINNTICKQVANRELQLSNFAKRHNVIIFVSGTKSSNGKILFEVCCSANHRSYSVINPENICKEWIEGVDSVGICGGTSTPLWLMEQCATKVKYLSDK